LCAILFDIFIKMSEKSFSADVEQLIELVTHSMYSNREIFLRELISNASDAIQKVKLKAIQIPDYLWDDHDLKIQIDIDKDKWILTVSDNGIWMTATEVEKHIGTIAKSGTKDFVKKMQKEKKASKENDMIGKFGIGFYSVFMIADRVELETKSNESKQASLWKSAWKWTYELMKSDRAKRWTEIRMYLKDDAKEFLEDFALKNLIKKHSNYVPVAVVMKEEKKDDKWKVVSNDYQQVNAMQSIWTKSKADVKKGEYKEFYQSMTFDQEEPLDVIHVSIEGVINYKAILFIPQKKNPMAMFGQVQEQEYGPSLYIQNVMVKEQTKELLPSWLRFVKWVVETNDLPLNVSREILQQSAVMSKISSSLVKEVIKSLVYTKEENVKNYEEFFLNYGQHLKEWVHMDFANKEKIAELLLFHSFADDKKISLDEYISKITDEKSKKIYYLSGKSLVELNSNPHLKQFKEKNIDVLLMDSPLDEWVVASLSKYKWYELKSVKSADIKIGDEKEYKEKKKEIDKMEQENKDFIAFMIAELGKEKIDMVKFVHSHSDSLANFVHKEWEPTAQMERMYKAMGQDIPVIRRTVALNLENPLVQKYLDVYQKNSSDESLKNFVKYVYGQAILLDGGELENVHEFVQVVNGLVGKSSDV